MHTPVWNPSQNRYYLRMKQFFSFILCLFVGVSIGPLSADEISLKSIFNGKDFTGWEVPKDNIWFTAKDGILKLENENVDNEWFSLYLLILATTINGFLFIC